MGMESDDLLLAQRAASEGPRWTRAVGDQSASIPEEIDEQACAVSYAVIAWLVTAVFPAALDRADDRVYGQAMTPYLYTRPIGSMATGWPRSLRISACTMRP